LRAEPLAGFVTRATVDIELRTWFDDIAERDPYELAPTPSWVRATIDANLAGIQEKVVDQVKAARKSLFTGVPQQ
jgi:SPX domain protein involved in polyphosphate accumulation